MVLPSLGMPGGDDVNAVVLDVGSANFRAGFAGEDTPRIFQCTTLRYRSDGSDDVDMTRGERPKGVPANYFVASAHSSLREAVSTDGKTGMVDIDKEVLSDILHYSFRSSSGFRVDPADSPIMLTEPNKTSVKYRKACLETVFEEFNFPAASLLKRAIGSAFAVGKTSGLVVDVGASLTSFAPIYEGFSLQKPLMEFPQIGGDLLDSILDEILKKKKIPVSPYYKAQPVSEEYLAKSRLAVVRELKHELCRLSLTPLSNVAGYASWNLQTDEETRGKLPDGTVVELGGLGQVIPELLFDPTPIRAIPNMSQFVGSFSGIPTCAIECINSCDVDVRKQVASDLILTGGSSLFSAFPERLAKAMAGSGKCKVTATPVNVERMSSSWLGSSILASCATFQQMWVSRGQFEEEGADRVSNRQLFW